MTEAHPCLLSISKSSKYRHLPFLQDEVKIGRSDDATYTILSTTISRCHAIITRQEDNTWTIMDNKSLNGTSVNGERLGSLEPYILQEGDIVQLGVPPNPNAAAQFIYRFFSSLKVRRETSKKRPSSEDASGESKRLKAAKDRETDYDFDYDSEESCDGKGEKENEEESQAEADSQLTEAGEQQDEAQAQAQDGLRQQYEEQLQKLAQQLKEQEQEKLAMAQQLEQERQERQVMEQRQREQEERVNQLDTKQRQLVEEKVAAEEALRQEMEERVREREDTLRCQMQQQLQQLAQEKQEVEQRLAQEKEKAVQEKDRQLQGTLQAEKDRLQKIIENKELEQKALESQLAEVKVEREKAHADTLTAKEVILSEFAETMETELQCAICNELFVKATSLNCSHAFCSLCLRQWLAVKMECPNCRAAVTSQTHSIVLDNYIDRMVEQLSADMKQRRTQLVAERKEEERKLDQQEQMNKAGPSGTRVRGRGSRREVARRGGARGRGRRMAYINPPFPIITNIREANPPTIAAAAAGGPASAVAATTAANAATRPVVRLNMPPADRISAALASIATRVGARARARESVQSSASSSTTTSRGATVSTATAGATTSTATTTTAAASAPTPNVAEGASTSASATTSAGADAATATTSAAAAETTAATPTETASVPSVSVPAVAATVTVESSEDSERVDADTTGAIVVSDDNDNDNDSVVLSDSSSYSSVHDGDLVDIMDPWDVIDSDDDVDDDDDDGDDYLRGTGAYYGGYGRCFKCGMRGHWANGCPMR